MTTFLAALAIIAVAFVGMAIGVIVSNRGLKGTCGGLANMRDADGRTLCDACDNPSPTCRREQLQQGDADHSDDTSHSAVEEGPDDARLNSEPEKRRLTADSAARLVKRRSIR
jgi:hypothetical protein